MNCKQLVAVMSVMGRESFVIIGVRMGSTFISICSALFWEGDFLTEMEEGKRGRERRRRETAGEISMETVMD